MGNSRIIGSGSTSKVFRSREGIKSFAIKKVVPNFYKFFKAEVAALQELKHPHITHLYETTCTENETTLKLEFSKQGSLRHYIETKAPNGVNWEKRGYAWAYQMSSALAYMHKHNWVHLDVNTGNMLLFNNTLKLSDLGLAMRLPISNKDFHGCGTPHYSSPEQLECEGITEKSDIYPLGSVLWEMHHGESLTKHLKLNELFTLMRKNEPLADLKKNVPEKVQKIIHQCWQLVPCKRPSAASIAETFTG